MLTKLFREEFTALTSGRSVFVAIFGAASVLAVGGCGKEQVGTEKTPPIAATSTAAIAALATAKPVPEPVQKFLGRWMRADGGYVLELRRVEQSGKVEAGYFNPKPINVSQAIWMQGADGFQVAVELNDVGYPGATYLLQHNTQTDRLVGKYTQPAMQQSFDIEFIRQPNAPPGR
jgi:hypothetical protein